MTIPIAQRINDIAPFYVMALLQRAKQLEAQGRDIIHLEIGEPDFATPNAVIEAGVKYLQQGQVNYTPAAGLMALRQKIVDFYQGRYGVSIDKKRVFVTPGASGAFLLALGASINPNDEVLLADPCYPCNRHFIRLFEARSRLVPVDASQNYQLNSQLIEKNWGASTKGVLIASPSNPTGTIIDEIELAKSIKTVHQLGGVFFSDEIYHGLVYGGRANTALQSSDDVFVMNSFSKYFGMTGWRIGWLIAPEAYCEAIEKLAQNIFISTPSHSQYAALAAFEPENLQELDLRRDEFAKRRDYLYQRLLELGFEISIKPEGAFYIYANCQKFSEDSFQFATDLLESEGVAITPGKDFGDYQQNSHCRFAYTNDIPRLEEAMQRLERFINQ